jgi:mono/diheme cytochrome c family protein
MSARQSKFKAFLWLLLILCKLTSCLKVPPVSDATSVPENPTYVDVEPIFANHCNLCHGAPPERGAPKNFVLDSYNDTGTYLGAKSMAGTVALQVKNGTMPPKGGLGTNNAAILEKWASIGAPLDSSDLSSTSDDNSASTSGTSDTYTSKYKAIIDDTCGGCHTNFSTLSDVQSAAQDMIIELESGSMPQNNPSFLSTSDGQALLDWLKSGNLN